MSIISAILALGLLIFVHELGHFLVAKFFSVQVLEFAIGFGPRIWGFHFGGTAYSIRAIPLGGYVRMAGESPHDFEEFVPHGSSEEPSSEEDSTVADLASESITRELATDSFLPPVTEDRSRWFLSQKYLPKFFIVLAGPAFNIFFAIFLAWFALFLFGKPDFVNTATIGDVMPGLPADEAGLKSGDLVLSVNDKEIQSWKELSKSIRSSKGKVVELLVDRDGEKVTLRIQPTLEKTELDVLLEDENTDRYKIGIFPATVRRAVSFWESGYYGLNQVYSISDLTLRGLSGMVMGKVSTDNIAGPLFIFKQGSEAAKTGLDRLIEFMVFLSVSLALLNLLPIPVLDGGHLVFFTIEAIR
ncbi:MAG: site-2 protease family protein, partial [Bdellovibrionales bacterium]|nr:site-2 protease family protein [Bdellovibrionales bacterium]